MNSTSPSRPISRPRSPRSPTAGFRAAGLALGSLILATVSGANVEPLPDDPACTAEDRALMKRAIELSDLASQHGNTAYGALLVKDGKVLMEFENNALTTGDFTHHAETGLISLATSKLGFATVAGATLYTSTEPCIMCCGAIRFAGIKRFVYGVTGGQAAKLRGIKGPDRPLRSREILSRAGGADIVILGPLLEREGLAAHAAAHTRAAAR